MEKEIHGVKVMDDDRDNLSEIQQKLLEGIEPSRRKALIYIHIQGSDRIRRKWEDKLERTLKDDEWSFNFEKGYCMEARKQGAYFFLHPNVFSGYVADGYQLANMILALKEHDFTVETASITTPLYTLTQEHINEIYKNNRELIDGLILDGVKRHPDRDVAFDVYKQVRLPTVDNLDRPYFTGDFEHLLIKNELDCLIRLGRIKERDGELFVAKTRDSSR